MGGDAGHQRNALADHPDIRRVHLLLTEREAEAVVALGGALAEFMDRTHPFQRAADKADEQVAAQQASRDRWKADDAADLLWDATQDMRNRHPDDPALMDWAQKLVNLVVGAA